MKKKAFIGVNFKSILTTLGVGVIGATINYCWIQFIANPKTKLKIAKLKRKLKNVKKKKKKLRRW